MKNCIHGIRKGTCKLCRRLWGHQNYGHTEWVAWPEKKGVFDFNYYGEGFDGVAKAITAGTQLDRDMIQHSRKVAGVEALPHKHRETVPVHRQLPWLAARLGDLHIAERFREVAEHFSFDYKMTLKMLGEIQLNPLKLLELEFFWTETKQNPPEIEFSQTPLWDPPENDTELESDFQPTDEYKFHRAEPEPQRSWYAFQSKAFIAFIRRINKTSSVEELRKLQALAEKSKHFQRRSVALFWIRRRQLRIKEALSPAARYLIVRIRKGQKLGQLLYQIQKGLATTPLGKPTETEWPKIWATFREYR